MYDVVILGAGVSGCAVAYGLAAYNVRAAVIDRASDVCEGTSKANTAIVHAGHDTAPGTLKSKYNLRGNAMYDDLCAALDVPFQRNGTLVVAFESNRRNEIDALAEQGVRNGCPGVRAIDQEELRQIAPQISPNAVGALYAPSGGIVSPYELVTALAENAVLNDTAFLLETTVQTIEQIQGGWRVSTDRGDVDGKIVVNCAGVYADVFNNMVSAYKYHITPRRGEYLLLDKTYKSAFSCSICTLPIRMATGHTKGVWVAPTVAGTILLGPTAQDVADKEDTANTAEGFAEIIEKTKLIWPDVPLDGCISCYAGLRAHSDRDDFVVGEAPDAPGFFNCGGIESPGLTAAPAIGADLAAQIAAKLRAGRREGYVAGRGTHQKAFRYMSDDERAAAIAEDPAYGRIVCRCETVTEAEIRDAIRRPLGARNLDAVKRRTRAGMGRCQSGFCTTRVMQILCEEFGVSPLEITKSGGASNMLVGTAFGDVEVR